MNETTRRYAHGLVAAMFAITSLLLVGCPLVGPTLVVNPTVINFGKAGVEESFTIYNGGSGSLDWSLQLVADGGGAWLLADVNAGSVSSETDRVHLTADRTGLAPGEYHATVTVTSGTTQKQVLVAMSVAGSPNLEVNPTTLNFLGATTTATTTVRNTGTGQLAWSLVAVDEANPGVTLPLPDYLTAAPAGGTLAVGQSVDIVLTLDRDGLEDGVSTVPLRIQSDGGSQDLTVQIAAGLGPELAVEPLVLDFGDRTNELTFDIFNIGYLGSELAFTLSTDRPDLILLSPSSGSVTSIGFPWDNPKSIEVRIDRTAIKKDTDGGKITVEVPGLDPVEVLVSVERAPLTFEAAKNRTRPPFIMRFTFTLRDSLGLAIDSTQPSILNELQTAFSIVEDANPIDLNETNFYVSGGGNAIRGNVAFLLDYTGSMYAALERMNPTSPDPLQELYAGKRNVAGDVGIAEAFIRGLTPSYRLALMEYHERQQQSRILHSFTTGSRDSMVQALEDFNLPEADHGASEIFDALIDAATRLENEDSGVLPLDDADLRAIVFLSDGRDTSSTLPRAQAITKLKEKKVRLFPIGFGENIDSSALVDLAVQTGGHYYSAPTQDDLYKLLVHDPSGAPDAPGIIASDLERQVVLNYVTLFQEGNHTYNIEAQYQNQRGSIELDAEYAVGGDVRAGQLALRTAGIQPDGTAEVYLRTDYVPRGVTQFKIRLYTDTGAPFTVALAPGGLIEDWVMVENTEVPAKIPGSRLFTVLTTEDNPLRYGAFGNLLRLNFQGLDPMSVVNLSMRVDNRIYVNPPTTKFFQHPEILDIRTGSRQASVQPILIADGFNPDAAQAWNRDGDAADDFDDAYPDDTNRQ